MSKVKQHESMNILLLAEDFYPTKSGGAFIDWNIATYLEDTGDNVTVVTPGTDGTARSEVVDGVEIRRPFSAINPDKPSNSLTELFKRLIFLIVLIPYLIYLNLARDFDIVYSTNHLLHSSGAFVSAVFGLTHVSFVGYSPSIHSDVSLTDPLVFLERLNFKFFLGNLVICQSPKIYKVISQISNTQVVRLDGCIDPGRIKEVARTTEESIEEYNAGGKTQLIFVGRLSNLKNPVELPGVLAQLSPKYSLLIVGDGPKHDAVESAIDKAGVRSRVKLVGELSHERALSAIYTSDILILPSKADAYPAVVFEALSLNTPVVGTPVGVLPKIEHSDLYISELDKFHDKLQEIEIYERSGFDEETLRRYSVNQLAQDIREHMIRLTNQESPPNR